MVRSGFLKSMLAGGVSALALTLATGALAQTGDQPRSFDVPAGGLKLALDTYARQSGTQLIYRVDEVSGV